MKEHMPANRIAVLMKFVKEKTRLRRGRVLKIQDKIYSQERRSSSRPIEHIVPYTKKVNVQRTIVLVWTTRPKKIPPLKVQATPANAPKKKPLPKPTAINGICSGLLWCWGSISPKRTIPINIRNAQTLSEIETGRVWCIPLITVALGIGNKSAATNHQNPLPEDTFCECCIIESFSRFSKKLFQWGLKKQYACLKHCQDVSMLY